VSEDGQTLFLRSLPTWRAAIARQRGREVEISIRRKAEPTSHDTHGYYRGVVLPLAAEEWGWADPDELHDALKLKHLPGIIPLEDERWRVRRFGVDDERVEAPSMADMSQEESGLYLDAVIRQMQEDGIAVPPPMGRE
jgi:hypothetical protein